MRLFAPLIRALRLRLRAEGGFTIVELVVAQGLIFVSLLSLAYTTTIGFQDIAVARQRQSANGLANETLEQVRALPFEVVSRGLSNSDLSGDAAIRTSGCPAGAAYCYRTDPPSATVPCSVTVPCEALASGTFSDTPVPLVPHRRTRTVGPTTYTLAVYVTRYRENVQGDIPDAGVVELPRAFRVTAVVTWATTTRGATGRVTAQTVIYSPDGCISAATHPFAAPCQPFLYATAQVPQGTIDMTATPGSGINGIRTTDFERATIFTISEAAAGQAEQITAVSSRSLTSGILLKRLNNSPTVAGQQVITTSADNDPGQPGEQDPAPVALTGSGAATYSLTGSNNNNVLVTSAAADSLTSRSTMTATGANACVPIPDNLPCAKATARQVNPNEIRITSKGNGADTGVAVLARTSGTATTDSSALIHRDIPAGMDGSMGAEVTRVVGDIRFGGLPANVTTVPAGWDSNIGLLRIQGYRGTAVAQAGTSTTALPLSAAVTAGAVQFWNGTGYTTLDLRTAVAGTAPRSFTVSLNHTTTVGGRPVQIAASGSFSAGGVATVEVGTATNRSVAEATLLSPLLGTFTYTVDVGPAAEAEHLQVDLTIAVDLGNQVASARYVTPSPAG